MRAHTLLVCKGTPGARCLVVPAALGSLLGVHYGLHPQIRALPVIPPAGNGDGTGNAAEQASVVILGENGHFQGVGQARMHAHTSAVGPNNYKRFVWQQ